MRYARCDMHQVRCVLSEIYVRANRCRNCITPDNSQREESRELSCSLYDSRTSLEPACKHPDCVPICGVRVSTGILGRVDATPAQHAPDALRLSFPAKNRLLRHCAEKISPKFKRMRRSALCPAALGEANSPIEGESGFQIDAKVQLLQEILRFSEASRMLV